VTSAAKVYRARWLIPADGPVVEDGAIVALRPTQGDPEQGRGVAVGSRIVRVGPWTQLRPHVAPSDAVEHFPDAAILPGFVNAHTHLGLSYLTGQFEPTADFAAWITRLVSKRLVRTKGAVRRGVRQGIEQGLAAGTIAGADVTPDVECDDGLGRADGRWTVFGEAALFGERGLERVAKTAERLARLAAAAPVRVGLSPHAPYSTALEVYLAARHEADARGWPLTTHLHETLDEIAFTDCGEGSLYELMHRYRLLPRDWRPAGARPIRMLAEAGFFSGPVLVAHGNYLTDDDIAVLAQSRSSVAWCPRSAAFFGHTDHPWRRLLAAGVNVCLGTDSLASSPSLSVLDEARHIFSGESGADPRLVLDLATRRGARALGLEAEVGNLKAGLAAECCVIEPVGPTKEPLAAILAGESTAPRLIRA